MGDPRHRDRHLSQTRERLDTGGFRGRWQATPGRYWLLARATEERGLRQPNVAPWSGKGYAQNGIHAVDVAVRG